MDLKQKLAAAFAGIPDARIVRLTPIDGRWLVYLSSPTFEGKLPLERQIIVQSALRGSGSPLSAAERDSIGLVRTFSPRELRGYLAERRAKRARKQKPAEPTP